MNGDDDPEKHGGHGSLPTFTCHERKDRKHTAAHAAMGSDDFIPSPNKKAQPVSPGHLAAGAGWPGVGVEGPGRSWDLGFC